MHDDPIFGSKFGDRRSDPLEQRVAGGANGGMLEAVLVVPVIEIFALIARASTMLNFWDGAADVL